MNIIQALDDPHLFAPHFRGPSWAPWRGFLKTWSGLGASMTEDEAALFRMCTGRETLPGKPFGETTLICGRRAGKSRVMALLAVFLAVFRDYSGRLAPGEMATVAVIAADRRQARVILRYVTGLLRAVPMLSELVEEELAESITLSNSVQIEVATASWRVTRGYSFAAVLCDEIAFWRDEGSSANPAEEIIRAIRPGLATLDGVLLKASSPHARKGVLFNDWRRHFGRDDARALVWRAATRTMNATVPQHVIDEAVEDDPQAAAAEFGAEFRSDLADFVAREAVDAVVVSGRFELPPVPRVAYKAFCDPSGGSSDSMTLAIAHREGGRAVLDAVREVRAPFAPDAVVTEFADVLRSYGLRKVEGDRYAGLWPTERFAAHGITYEPASHTKSDTYLAVLPAINSGSVELLDVPRLVGQLAALERRSARGGRDTVDHPPNQHDDVINAAAGALLACTPQGMSVMDRMRVLSS